ncbi:MAG: DEAD/DEAH box helicase [Planctomycetes bacterium]|nr:DEAD/DEAH box helicase [Planctomycetota bacterium]
MIPSVVARQVRSTVLDYLRTTFAFSDEKFEQALFEFLGDEERGLFRGPFLDVRLPFQTAADHATIPLDIRPAFRPYRHQQRAFQRLYSKGGHQPQHTLVVTGTGSGKTECFLYPILDHCWRSRGELGVKAILLYPMNALASDQARRLAQTLWADQRLRGVVSAGLYVGGKGRHKTASAEHLVDDRDVLRDSPPDVLLTNYRMLDFLLLRPEDRELWRHNGPDTLRYLVLDELHTYDGAQGSDVACLLRRLKARVGSRSGSVCFVGTSATVGGGSTRGQEDLVRFASEVSGDAVFEDAVILEDRMAIAEVFPQSADLDVLPPPGSATLLDPDRAVDPQTWLQQQVELWIGAGAATDPLAVGAALERHAFLRQLLRALDQRVRDRRDVDAWLREHEEGWATRTDEERRLALDSFLALLSYARKRVTDPHTHEVREVPFLTVQIQLWLRELHRLVQRLTPEPEFHWFTDGPPDPERGRWLPIAHCRECGSSGWAGFGRHGDPRLVDAVQEIGSAWLHRTAGCCYVQIGHSGLDGDSGEPPARPDPTQGGFPLRLHPLSLQIAFAERCADHAPYADGSLPVRIAGDVSRQTPAHFLQRCPDCGADGTLRILGSRAATLLSVAIGHLFQSEWNDDRKLLAFTDSVQDASHRAGFFGARTWRFVLRTALQGALEAAGDDVPLDQLGHHVLDWLGRAKGLGPEAQLAALLPDDLRGMPPIEAWLDPEIGAPPDDALDVLRSRLSWEAVREYGLAVVAGRTLERTGCSTAAPAGDALDRAAEVVQLEITEQGWFDGAAVEASRVRHWLAGIVQRLRLRGGVTHPMLAAYVREGGKKFLLSKRKEPMLSPFGRFSIYPRFLTDRAREAGRDTVFDPVVSDRAALTWHRDWTARALGVDRRHADVQTALLEALRRLEQHGLLERFAMSGQGNAYGLRREALRVTRDVGRVRCDTCGRDVVLPAPEVPHHAGRPCWFYRCGGSLAAMVDEAPDYYARIYRSGRVERIVAREHTGLLPREVREDLEDAFKKGGPGAPNLFVCTPTLEMGIDIGDLSATVLCTVPPTTANFLQRVGRAGRKTGNALCLTMADSRPHDLYFLARPQAMMAGDVTAPGVFLDAPEVLRRQLIAFAMDAWAREETEKVSIPGQARLVLGEAQWARFPGRFLAFHRERWEELFAGFVAAFGATISEANIERLRPAAGPQNVQQAFRDAFDALEAERDELRQMLRRTRERLKHLDEHPEEFEDPATERVNLEDGRRMLSDLVDEIGSKYPLNVLTDAGVLPNYAFPEPGVTLKSVVREDAAHEERSLYRSYEYMRPASSAIKELAPFNTFYAEGRHVTINELDIGSRARPAWRKWRLCAQCSHMAPASPDSDGDTAELAAACPRCGDPNWSDSGQVRQLVLFRRSRSLATRLESATVDDGDDREREPYEVLDLIDVAPENARGARWIEELPFGFETLTDVPLRQVNFGPLDAAGRNQVLSVSGRPIVSQGFRVCVDCGRVHEPGRPELVHVPWCIGNRAPDKAKVEAVLLYREVRSEAIRILVPAAELDHERRTSSFKAALALGLRRRFHGDPDHLRIGVQDEPPRAGEAGRRRYLVVFDRVPGGTGYLTELGHGDNLREVLTMALRAMQSCSCREEGRDGCYRCLFAYQSQFELDSISSRVAQEMVREILARWDRLVALDNLSGVSLGNRIESELEERFLIALRDRAKAAGVECWRESVQRGERIWEARFGDRWWRVEAQVDLGEQYGARVATRPDFVLRPVDGDPAVLPVAVYCDGFAYHVQPDQPTARIGDDLVKRDGLLRSAAWRVWSVTWRDLDDLEAGSRQGSVPELVRGVDPGGLGRLCEKLGVRGRPGREVLGAGAMTSLFEYLAHPVGADWTALVDAWVLAWLLSPPWTEAADAEQLAERLAREPAQFESEPAVVQGPPGPVVAHHAVIDHAIVVAAAPRTAIGAGSLAGLRITLRLFDEAECRRAEEFEASWRAVLQLWNRLQFCSVGAALVVTSSERIGAGDAVEAGVESVSRVAEPEVLYGLLRLVAEEVHELVREIVARGLPRPDAGYELVDETGRVVAEAELAWIDRRLAVLTREQSADRARFEAAGWRVHVAGVTVDGLGLQPENDA